MAFMRVRFNTRAFRRLCAMVTPKRKERLETQYKAEGVLEFREQTAQVRSSHEMILPGFAYLYCRSHLDQEFTPCGKSVDMAEAQRNVRPRCSRLCLTGFFYRDQKNDSFSNGLIQRSTCQIEKSRSGHKVLPLVSTDEHTVSLLNRASRHSYFDTPFSQHEEYGYDVDATVSGDFRVTEEFSLHSGLYPPGVVYIQRATSPPSAKDSTQILAFCSLSLLNSFVPMVYTCSLFAFLRGHSLTEFARRYPVLR